MENLQAFNCRGYFLRMPSNTSSACSCQKCFADTEMHCWCLRRVWKLCDRNFFEGKCSEPSGKNSSQAGLTEMLFSVLHNSTRLKWWKFYFKRYIIPTAQREQGMLRSINSPLEFRTLLQTQMHYQRLFFIY